MRTIIRFRGILSAVGITLLLAACSDGAATGPDREPPENPPGHGAGKFDNPTGAKFTLPAGVELVGRIAPPIRTNGDSLPGCLSLDTTVVKRLGRGITMVNLCFRLRNTTGQMIPVRFPPRVIVVSKKTRDQHGVLIEHHERIEIPPHGDVWIDMGLYCINQRRSVPGADSEYEFGPVTDDPQLKEISDLVSDRNLSDPMHTGVVQMAIWEVTDGGGLTNAMRQQLRHLPPR